MLQTWCSYGPILHSAQLAIRQRAASLPHLTICRQHKACMPVLKCTQCAVTGTWIKYGRTAVQTLLWCHLQLHRVFCIGIGKAHHVAGLPQSRALDIKGRIVIHDLRWCHLQLHGACLYRAPQKKPIMWQICCKQRNKRLLGP